ncbi:uncharacterized protein LOC131671567 isoform X2 [Phymastichus coffea]|uniref:uncharacterized protein LOC131671567 isoform X2 n=1 Tax=Phymastichus coffea TaxID=108790 RepID=UPI00273BA884|nr:uncharacterized protein LOC131671567 isoform X2 [Phymastichus coffea]
MLIIQMFNGKHTSSHIKVDQLNVDATPNEYFGKISSEVKPLNDDSSISVTVPVKKNLHEKLQVTANLNFNNLPILKDEVIVLCDAIAENGFFQPIVKKVEPSDKFPKSCPIPAGEWKITNYVIDMDDYLPFGLVPSGNFDGQFDIGLPNAKPMIKIVVNGTVSPFGGVPSSLKSLFELI